MHHIANGDASFLPKHFVYLIKRLANENISARVTDEAAGNVSTVMPAEFSLFGRQIAETAAAELNDKRLLG